VANAAGTTVWRWDQQEPFGSNPADENPSGLGVFDLPLRLPGQYLDKETNLHYNYFRDYDPATGRYVQSDPIGLAGGLNPYLYVGGNPISYVDPKGEITLAAFAVGVVTAAALWALPHLILPDPPLPPGSDAIYPDTFPDGSGLLKCVAALGVIRGVGQKIASYEVGTFGTLAKRSRGDGLEIHHGAQKHPASQVISDYDAKNGPSIALPRGEHRQIPTISGEYRGTARDLLAKDIRDLRNYTNAPNRSLQELIQINKSMYPSSFSK
jgi:RHS repeat-associated protein